MDIISEASKNVSDLLNKKLQVAPVFVKQILKQSNEENTENKENPDTFNSINISNIVKAYEIWKVFLDRKKAGFDCCYVIISGDYQQKGYANGEWSNFSYCGFYTTIEEAENEVMAYFE